MLHHIISDSSSFHLPSLHQFDNLSLDFYLATQKILQFFYRCSKAMCYQIIRNKATSKTMSKIHSTVTSLSFRHHINENNSLFSHSCITSTGFHCSDLRYSHSYIEVCRQTALPMCLLPNSDNPMAFLTFMLNILLKTNFWLFFERSVAILWSVCLQTFCCWAYSFFRYSYYNGFIL